MLRVRLMWRKVFNHITTFVDPEVVVRTKVGDLPDKADRVNMFVMKVKWLDFINRLRNNVLFYVRINLDFNGYWGWHCLALIKKETHCGKAKIGKVNQLLVNSYLKTGNKCDWRLRYNPKYFRATVHFVRCFTLMFDNQYIK